MRHSICYEQERVSYVRGLRLSNDERDADLDRVVHDLSQMTDCPIAMVSLVEGNRVWFKAAVGLNVQQVRRSIAFCSDTIMSPCGIEVLDASCHRRYRNNPLVTGVASLRFYSGLPITPRNGYPIGALCVLDTKPRGPLSSRQRIHMQSLCRNVAALIAHKTAI